MKKAWNLSISGFLVDDAPANSDVVGSTDVKSCDTRGVAVFGMSGSGKSSTAAAIAETGAIAIEASTDIVLPLSAFTELPSRISDLVSQIIKMRDGHLWPAIGTDIARRADARRAFVRLSRKYGDTWIALVIDELHARLGQERFLVVSGVRGIANARLLGQLGYLTVFLKGIPEVLAKRQAKRDHCSLNAAELDQRAENGLYHTREIEEISDLVIDTTHCGVTDVARLIHQRLQITSCRRCVSTTANPIVQIEGGLCAVCRCFDTHYQKAKLNDELDFVRGFIGSGHGNHDVLVGMSGGKDSSAAAFLIKKLGFNPLGFTFDTGYYPDHIFKRARLAAEALGIRHTTIDIRKYMAESSIRSYQVTADLYDLEESSDTARLFRRLYQQAREHYSVKDDRPMAYVRSCQLCRKTVIPGYYWEALASDVRLVVLGMNEWTKLSQRVNAGNFAVSGIRKLQPFRSRPAVYVVHLPFLLRLTRPDLEGILDEIGWQAPPGEDLVESNSNSCLLARAAEAKAQRMLRFHPDATRLAREVTAGFLNRTEALAALNKKHPCSYSVREILQKAMLID